MDPKCISGAVLVAIGGDTGSLVWMVLAAGLPLLWGSMGVCLLRGGWD